MTGSLLLKEMRYFGINQGRHDGGIACFDETGRLILFSQTERLTRKKADVSVGVLSQLLDEFGIEALRPTDLFFNSWPKYYKSFYDLQGWPKDNFTERVHGSAVRYNARQQAHFLNHHLCHVASSWMFRGKCMVDECLYIAIDGSGLRPDGSEGFYSVGVISENSFQEVENELDKFRYSPYHRLDQIALPGTGLLQVAGKLMGMAGHVPKEELNLFTPPDVKLLNKRLRADGLTRQNMLNCAEVYIGYIEDVKAHIGTLLAKHGHEHVVVGGGAFLALELNTWLAEQGKKVIFGPPMNDSGIAMGSAACGFFLAHGRWPLPLTSPYLQWCPRERRDAYQTPKQVAEYLAKDGVVGVVTGQGEAGPRALGNRSLLAFPTIANARKVSMDLKGREFYRPVAPLVTENAFEHFFRGPKGRYMQYRNDCTERARLELPGIVHNDGSARAQVLCPNDHPWLYELLEEVGKVTGCECLINTSLNGPGLPICNTLSDARADFGQKEVRLVSF